MMPCGCVDKTTLMHILGCEQESKRMAATGIRLWLDDVRPAPPGWTWCKTVVEAKALMLAGPVDEMSLDHDLGMDAVLPDLSEHAREVLRQFGDVSSIALSPKDDGILLLRAMEFVRSGKAREENGYAFCCWMEETGRWPTTRPRVHSANPAGAARMREVIARRFDPPIPG